MKKLIESIKFFVKESKTYVSPWKFRDYLYYPVAFTKFMYYEISNK